MAHLDIANRLAIYGWKLELVDFDEALANLWWVQFESTHNTVEMMLHHPKAALSFCDKLRKYISLPDMPDEEILLRLTNIRKNNFLKDCELK